MKLVSIDPAHAITEFDSRDATIGGVARCAGEARVSLLRLAAGGAVGEHPAGSAQLFLVVAGSGWVRVAAEDRRAIDSCSRRAVEREDARASQRGVVR